MFRVVIAAAVACVASVSIAAESPSGAPASSGKTAKKAYVVPKTPWGDPDLQGNYTNKYEQGTPFERPAEFEGNASTTSRGKNWSTSSSGGKIPPLTQEGARRIAARPRTGSSFSNGVYDSYEKVSLYDRCITRGYPSSMLPAIYGDSYQIEQPHDLIRFRLRAGSV